MGTVQCITSVVVGSEYFGLRRAGKKAFHMVGRPGGTRTCLSYLKSVAQYVGKGRPTMNTLKNQPAAASDGSA
jgi:hypothetical protein